MSKYKNLIISQKGYKCEECGLTDWKNKAISLELDHIDGNHQNNDLKNLRLLCPNCHSQTNTFRGRNINTGVSKVSDEELLDALKNNKNIRQALICVGLTPRGPSYKRAYKLLNLLYKEKVVDTKNSQYGSIWVTKDTKNKKIKKGFLEEYISLGWKKGRYIDTNQNSLPSQKGKFWITNGIQNKMIKSPSEIPKGWWKGKRQK